MTFCKVSIRLSYLIWILSNKLFLIFFFRSFLQSSLQSILLWQSIYIYLKLVEFIFNDFVHDKCLVPVSQRSSSLLYSLSPFDLPAFQFHMPHFHSPHSPITYIYRHEEHVSPFFFLFFFLIYFTEVNKLIRKYLSG